MKKFALIICLLMLFPACAAKNTGRVVIKNVTPLSPVNRYIQAAITGNPDPALVQENYDKTEVYSIWADGLKARTVASVMGEKIVHTFNNGVILVMKPNLETGVVECTFNNGEAFVIQRE